MALDNANFIAELSITDPPGSDPLSQGDDQIRTIKRATFNSLPVLDKAVNITADQMNLMAIKNEANIFTARQTVNDTDFRVDAIADVAVSFTWLRSSIFRWTLAQLDDAGTNDLALGRFNASGVFQDNPWRVDATTGVVTFAKPPVFEGAPLWIAGEIRQFAIAASPGTNWFLADGTNGTANLADRWLVGSGAFAGAVGSNLNASLDAIASAITTGSTALSASQMPSHRHRLRDLTSGSGISDGTALAIANSVGSMRNVIANTFTDAGASGQLVENTGSGAGHTHPQTQMDVIAVNPTFTGSVQPVSVAVETYQYVP